MWHSLALLGIAWFCESRLEADSARNQAKWGHQAGFLFLIGIILFCGTLYAIGSNKALPIAGLMPAGGIALMAGWITFSFVASR
jgi:uncharacterized membrane protein YgdD (TMEM256/DUF423 family)